MKCVAISNFFPSHQGGLEIVVGEILARVCSATGMQCEWFASAPGDAGSGQAISGDTVSVIAGVSCSPLPCNNLVERRTGLPMPLWSLASLLKISRSIAKCDVVFLNDCLYFSTLAGWLLAKIHRRPVVVLQHIDMIPFRRPFLSWVMSAGYWILGWVILCHSERVVFCSRKVEGFFKRRFPRRLAGAVLVSHGVDVDLFNPGGLDGGVTLPARPRMLYAGRFIERKGMAILADLARKFPGCDWVFAGWGVIDPGSWNLANVQVAGRVDRVAMAELYRSCDLLVLPSAGEGFPLVVQEAISSGIPALVTPETASGDPDSLSMLMTAERSVEGFSAAVQAFLGRRREELGVDRRLARHAFARKRWGWDVSVSRWSELFSGIAIAREQA